MAIQARPVEWVVVLLKEWVFLAPLATRIYCDGAAVGRREKEAHCLHVTAHGRVAEGGQVPDDVVQVYRVGGERTEASYSVTLVQCP